MNRDEKACGKLKPCPFCGEMPESFGSGEGQKGLMIECISENCPNPSVSYYDHATAIAAWNRRAPTDSTARTE